MLITQTLIVRDRDLNIIDTIDIEPGREITRDDVRAIVHAHHGAVEVIERVETIEVRPS